VSHSSPHFATSGTLYISHPFLVLIPVLDRVYRAFTILKGIPIDRDMNSTRDIES